MNQVDRAKLVHEFTSVAIPVGKVAKLQALFGAIPICVNQTAGRVAHIALGLLTVPFRVIWRCKRMCAKDMVVLQKPVISVGSIAYGGSGKSPFCRLLAKWLHERGMNVGIVLPSYNPTRSCSKPDQQSLTWDEAFEHSYYLPEVPVAVNRRREVAAAELIERHGCDVVILDDGFQYRRLHRDLDIVLVDAFHVPHLCCPMLREFPSALRSADIVCVTKTDAARAFLGDHHLDAFTTSLNSILHSSNFIEVNYAPSGFIHIADDAKLGKHELEGFKVIGVVGTAEPFSFFFMLRQLGLKVVRLFIFDDHHSYSLSDIAMLEEIRSGCNGALITTLKDAMKLCRVGSGGTLEGCHRFTGWYALCIDAHIVSNGWLLDEALNKALKLQGC
ncbi:MAG: hypothetical protein RUDDFDWM_000934 [Candidatus Fervidibacterota bacterium]